MKGLTIFVPYSIACSVWKVPFLPVIPWQITRVFLSTKTAGGEAEVPKRAVEMELFKFDTVLENRRMIPSP